MSLSSFSLSIQYYYKLVLLLLTGIIIRLLCIIIIGQILPQYTILLLNGIMIIN